MSEALIDLDKTLLKLVESASKDDPPSTTMLLQYSSSMATFVGRDVDIGTARNWLDQFDPEDRETAYWLMWSLVFYRFSDVALMCRLALLRARIDLKDRLQDAVFVALGGPAKSSQLVSYLFRTANRLPLRAFRDLQGLAAARGAFGSVIVYLDDFIGTGSQFIHWWKQQCVSHREFAKIPQYYLALVGVRSGVRAISQETSVSVRVVQERNDYRDWVVVSLEKVKALADRYGRGLFLHQGEDLHRGYGSCLSGVVFFYNVPNNVPPIVWAAGKNARGQNWQPLFPRREFAQATPLDLVSHLLEKVFASGSFGEDEIVTLLEHLAALRDTGVSDLLPQQDILRATELLCSKIYGLSGGSGLKIWPPAIAKVFVEGRDWLVSLLGGRARRGNLLAFRRLIALFRFQHLTDMQDSFITFTLVTHLTEALRNLGPAASQQQIITLLRALACRDLCVGQGAFLVLWRIQTSRKFAQVTIPGIRDARFRSIQAEFWRLLLLGLHSPRDRCELEAYLSRRRQHKATWWYNEWGKMRWVTAAAALGGKPISEIWRCFRD